MSCLIAVLTCSTLRCCPFSLRFHSLMSHQRLKKSAASRLLNAFLPSPFPFQPPCFSSSSAPSPSEVFKQTPLPPSSTTSISSPIVWQNISTCSPGEMPGLSTFKALKMFNSRYRQQSMIWQAVFVPKLSPVTESTASQSTVRGRLYSFEISFCTWTTLEGLGATYGGEAIMLTLRDGTFGSRDAAVDCNDWKI